MEQGSTALFAKQFLGKYETVVGSPAAIGALGATGAKGSTAKAQEEQAEAFLKKYGTVVGTAQAIDLAKEVQGSTGEEGGTGDDEE